MPVLVHPDPSEKATFSLLNTDPVKEGDTVTMKCETDGNPQPEFDFTKDVCVHFMCIYGLYVWEGGSNIHLFVVLLFLLRVSQLLVKIHKHLSFYLQDKVIKGQGGLLILKSVKRTDNGVYKCTATDFDNLDADLSGAITLTVHCEWAKDTHTQTDTNSCRIKQLHLCSEMLFSSVNQRIKGLRIEWALMEFIREANSILHSSSVTLMLSRLRSLILFYHTH